MKSILFYITLITLAACSSDTINKELKQPIIEKNSIVDSEPNIEEEKIVIPVLPFFSLDFNDDGFEAFYLDLLEKCISKDTAMILNAFADSIRFSSYECAYGSYYKAEPDCESDCVRCSKKGMLAGVFSGSDNYEICTRLYDLITKYGMGPLSKNDSEYKWLTEKGAYANFYFKNTTDQKKYYDYQAFVPLEKDIPIRKEKSISSPSIGTIPFEIVEWSQEVGMGVYGENEEFMWYEYQEGYINSEKVLSGFNYTTIIFEKTHAGWRITGMFQPPGC